ncbi:Amidohydrolase [Balamuthia mandrillaris]
MIWAVCLQMTCDNDRPEANIDKAKLLVERAMIELEERTAASSSASRAPVLVLLPELMAAGYSFTTRGTWEASESIKEKEEAEQEFQRGGGGEGLTQTFLREMALKYSIYIGTTLVEFDPKDEHYYNTFLMYGPPEGRRWGMVRKSTPASFEAFFFRPEGDADREDGLRPHVIETPIGRIGVSICYENFLCQYVLPALSNTFPAYKQQSTVQHLSTLELDLLLMPFSCPVPEISSPAFLSSILPPTKNDVATFHRHVQIVGSKVASILRVPTLYCNKTGKWKTTAPFLPVKLTRSFPGESTICDSNGAILAKASSSKEQFIIASLPLPSSCSSSASKRKEQDEKYRKWMTKEDRYLFDFTPFFHYVWLISEWLGSLCYELARANKRKHRQTEDDVWWRIVSFASFYAVGSFLLVLCFHRLLS